MVEPPLKLIFDKKKSEEERDKAIDRVDSAVDMEIWKPIARRAIEYVAVRRAEFTTDAVWYVLEKMWEVEGPRERKVLGPVMLKARRDGVCEATNRFKASERAVAHAKPCRIWKSFIYKED